MTWLLGLPIFTAVLRLAVALVEMVAPIVKFVLESIAAAAKWLWLNVWWPGLRGIFDGLPQLLVIAQLVGVAVLLYLNASTQLAQRDVQLAQCRAALTKAHKPRARSTQPVPLWDLFGWFRLP